MMDETSHRRFHHPGSNLRADARPADRRRRGEVEPVACLLRSGTPRRCRAALAYGGLARTPADRAISSKGLTSPTPNRRASSASRLGDNTRSD
jgi:hypothetical protein